MKTLLSGAMMSESSSLSRLSMWNLVLKDVIVVYLWRPMYMH